MTTFNKPSNRRNFLRTGIAATAALKLGLPQTTTNPTIPIYSPGGILTAEDTAILQFALAMETVAADIWSQFADMVATSQSYATGFSNLDPALPQYILDISRDETSHRDFLAAYLKYAQQQPLSFSQFSTLPTYATIGAATSMNNPYAGYTGNLGLNPSNVATGLSTSSSSGTSTSTPTGRLTNLANVSINSSFLYEYRSAYNPDFSFTFPQALMNMLPQMLFGAGATASGGSLTGSAATIGQANSTAQTAQAVLLFMSMIEAAEGSMYLSLLPKISNPSFLSILAAIMPVEEMHYTALQTALARGMVSNLCTPSSSSGSTTSTTGPTTGNPTTGSSTSSNPTFTGCPANTSFSGSGTLTTNNSGAGNGTGSSSGLSFSNVVATPTQAESVLPAPTFLIASLPPVSAIRPSSTSIAGAVATVNALTAANVFQGQSQSFLSTLMSLANAADAAARSGTSSSSATPCTSSSM